jgi:hypothetical protein
MRVSTSVSKLISLGVGSGVVRAVFLPLLATVVGESVGGLHRGSDFIGGVWL